MSLTTPLLPGQFYHVYNRGNNRENLFIENSNYPYFLRKYFFYMSSVVETYAYCLMKNHFHVLIRVRTDPEQMEWHRQHKAKSPKLSTPSRQFSCLFNSYAKSVNKEYGRTGHLFEDRFRRLLIDSHEYLLHTLFYIHDNPRKHGFVLDLSDYPYSSFQGYMFGKSDVLPVAEVFQWFGGYKDFMDFHTSGNPDDRAGEIEKDEET